MPRRVRKPSQRRDLGTGEDFKLYRQIAQLTVREAATWLGVAIRTVEHWEAVGTRRVPYAAFRLMRIRCGYELPDPQWDGWQVRGGKLWSPAEQSFDPGGLAYLSLYFRMAEAWKQDYDKRAFERVAARIRGEEIPSGKLNENGRDSCAGIEGAAGWAGNRGLPRERAGTAMKPVTNYARIGVRRRSALRTRLLRRHCPRCSASRTR